MERLFEGRLSRQDLWGPRVTHSRSCKRRLKLDQLRLQPLRQLCGCLVGEGNHQHLAEFDATKHRQQHLANKAIGLARAGTRLNHP